MKFGIDRDFGLHISNLHEYSDRFSYNFRGAVTLGEGRKWTTNNASASESDNSGLAFTVKCRFYRLRNELPA